MVNPTSTDAIKRHHTHTSTSSTCAYGAVLRWWGCRLIQDYFWKFRVICSYIGAYVRVQLCQRVKNDQAKNAPPLTLSNSQNCGTVNCQNGDTRILRVRVFKKIPFVRKVFSDRQSSVV